MADLLRQSVEQLVAKRERYLVARQHVIDECQAKIAAYDSQIEIIDSLLGHHQVASVTAEVIGGARARGRYRE